MQLWLVIACGNTEWPVIEQASADLDIGNPFFLDQVADAGHAADVAEQFALLRLGDAFAFTGHFHQPDSRIACAQQLVEVAVPQQAQWFVLQVLDTVDKGPVDRCGDHVRHLQVGAGEIQSALALGGVRCQRQDVAFARLYVFQRLGSGARGYCFQHKPATLRHQCSEVGGNADMVAAIVNRFIGLPVGCGADPDRPPLRQEGAFIERQADGT